MKRISFQQVIAMNMLALVMMADFPFSQNLYVIPLLCRGQIIEVQRVPRNKEHGNKAHLCAVLTRNCMLIFASAIYII